MVKIAIAGGSGGKARKSAEKSLKPKLTFFFFAELAQEVIDALLALEKHQITT